MVAFSFQWTTDNIADVIDFRTATKVTDPNNQAGQGKEYLVSQMYDTDYAIEITKNDTGAATAIYPSAITKAGFTLNAENAKAYDISYCRTNSVLRQEADMKRKWIKDYCPFAKNQGFYSIVGNVGKGQKVFGFSHSQVAGTDAIVLATVTRKAITQMQDTGYEVIITDTSTASVVTLVYTTGKTKVGFNIVGEAAATYDVVVIGNVNY